jgi:hypothetical protein
MMIFPVSLSEARDFSCSPNTFDSVLIVTARVYETKHPHASFAGNPFPSFAHTYPPLWPVSLEKAHLRLRGLASLRLGCS